MLIAIGMRFSYTPSCSLLLVPAPIDLHNFWYILVLPARDTRIIIAIFYIVRQDSRPRRAYALTIKQEHYHYKYTFDFYNAKSPHKEVCDLIWLAISEKLSTECVNSFIEYIFRDGVRLLPSGPKINMGNPYEQAHAAPEKGRRYSEQRRIVQSSSAGAYRGWVCDNTVNM